MKINELRRIVIHLREGIDQEVIVCDRKDDIAFSDKGNIYVNKDFSNIYDDSEQKAVIYHERHHNTKEGKLFIFLSNISSIIGAFFLAVFLVNVIFYIIDSLYPIHPLFNNNLFLIASGILFICLFALFRWFAETMCDANAVKNTDKITFKNALIKTYDYCNTRRRLLKRIENNYLLHVPKRLRLRIIESWD